MTIETTRDGTVARSASAIALALLMTSSLVAFSQAATEGDHLIADGKWNEAEEWFYDRTRENPDDAEAFLKLGFVELRRPGGDARRAVKYLDRARELQPDRPQATFLLAKAYEAAGDVASAVSLYDELIEAGKGDGRDPERMAALHLARFNRALAALARGETELAHQLLAEVHKREPRHAYATYELALAALAEGDRAAAIEGLRKVLTDTLSWVPAETWPYPQGRYAYLRENARYELGRLLLEAGEAEEAVEVLEPLVSTVRVRDNAQTRAIAPPPASPLQGETDARFENAPLVYGEALAAADRVKEAVDVLKEFSRMSVGDSEMRSRARQLAKELKKRK